MNGRRPHDPNCPGWTETLQRAAELIAEACTNREMADIEVITEDGAKNQVRRVREHLEIEYDVILTGRRALIRFCRELGFGYVVYLDR